MRRSGLVVALALCLSFLLVSPAAATGPGGWNHVGTNGATPPSFALNGNVTALNADVPGSLYVGGAFSDAGGIAAADRIARWDGRRWSPLGAVPLGNGSVFAIATHNGKVYAGGSFVDAGGQAAADYLAVFDAGSWHPFCNSSSGAALSLQVQALQVVGSTLYVGGTFQNANGDPVADYLIGCNLDTGAMTTTVDHDGDFSGAVYALAATPDGTLYAGGTLSNLDGVATANGVAYYDGSWHGLGTAPIGGIVRGLHASGSSVYVSSDGLDIAGSPQADHLVRWDGAMYNAVGSNRAGNDGYFPSSTTINALATSGPLLFAAGNWQDADGDPTGDGVAYYDGVRWRPLGSDGLGNGPWGGEAQELAVFGGQVYAGGALSKAGGDPLAGYAASRSLTLPDARARRTTTGPYVGDNRYDGAAAGQSVALPVPRGTARDAYVDVQNDGMIGAAFRLHGTGTATGWTATYWRGSVDVTAAVRSGSYSTGTLVPGAHVSLRVSIRAGSAAAGSVSFTTSAASTAGTPVDAVRLVASRS